MSSFGFAENESEYNSITNQYSETYRAYHNVQHISDCLEKLDLFCKELENWNVIELAIWFHDAVYNPYAKNNELNSADVAVDFLRKAGAKESLFERVTNLILATRHNSTATSEEEKIISDIDLSILGASPDVYERYSKNIRKEYKLIPSTIFRKKRKEILTEFLEREPLFQTPLFRNRFEKQAKENIKRELEKYS